MHSQRLYVNEKLLPLWGGHEITLEGAENLREADEETAEMLNEAGKTTLIYKKKMRNHYLFPQVSEDALILKESDERNYEKFSLNLFKNPPVVNRIRP